jgi:hypothetical protein
VSHRLLKYGLWCQHYAVICITKHTVCLHSGTIALTMQAPAAADSDSSTGTQLHELTAEQKCIEKQMYK